MKERSRLEYLFHAYFSKTATAEEQQELMQLLSENDNEAQLEAAMEEAWQQLHPGDRVFTQEQGEALVARIHSSARRRHHKVYLLRAAAAAVLLGIVAAAYLWLNPARRPLKDRQAIAAKQQPVHDIAPGGNKAVLTLANGTSVVLDDTQTGLLAKQGGTQVVKAGDGLLTYHKNQPASGAVLYNTLSTPRGGQYQLVLPDGTRVWMNASSSIRFPTEFREKERNITLSGEAYFEVAQDAAKPFKVTVAASGGRNGFTIDVLGTHFNVMAYEEEQTCSTTLLEGAVRIGSGGTYNKLLPGEQAKIDQRNTVKIVHPDMDEVMAWKNGEFLFNSYGIEKIMRQLSRWYDVEVVYEGKIPEGHFSGAVNRNNNISQVLKILEAGGVRFLIEGRKLIVKS